MATYIQVEPHTIQQWYEYEYSELGTWKKDSQNPRNSRSRHWMSPAATLEISIFHLLQPEINELLMNHGKSTLKYWEFVYHEFNSKHKDKFFFFSFFPSSFSRFRRIRDWVLNWNLGAHGSQFRPIMALQITFRWDPWK